VYCFAWVRREKEIRCIELEIKKRVLIEGALEKKRENIEKKIMYGICGT